MLGSFKKLFYRKKIKPQIIARSNHTVSRQHLSKNALKVLYRLHNAGFKAYLVGGGVRDLLLQNTPKDFDIVTSARPKQVKKLFRNSRIIGRRFRLVHVTFYGEIIEVSTFRAYARPKLLKTKKHLAKANNRYGSMAEDVSRRDFTINALYYNINDFSLVDYFNGTQDIANKIIRLIGDPEQRYREDPVRLLRAMRFAAKLDFSIDTTTAKPIVALKSLLSTVPAARLHEEVLKLFFSGKAVNSFEQLNKYHYIEMLFPGTYRACQRNNQHHNQLIQLALAETDKRYYQHQSLNPGFLFAVLLWPALNDYLTLQQPANTPFALRLHHAISQTLREQHKHVLITKRQNMMIRSIWLLQFQLQKQRPSRIIRITQHRYFRAAVDFLELRANAGEIDQKQAIWWRTLLLANKEQREQLILDYKTSIVS